MPFRPGLWAALAVCSVLGLVWSLPQPDVQALRVRQHALSVCNDALTAQALRGHRLGGFRLIPSSITRRGQDVQADYLARTDGREGWSGPLRTVHCTVAAERVQLSLD